LKFQLVEGFDLTAPVDVVSESGKAIEKVDGNGKVGQAVSWNEQTDSYVVRTFDGIYLSFPNANLRLYQPPAPENGGFDMCWPCHMDAFFDFASEVHGEIVAKSWCLLQLSKTDLAREETVHKATKKTLVSPREEFANDFIGSGGAKSRRLTPSWYSPLTLSEKNRAL